MVYYDKRRKIIEMKCGWMTHPGSLLSHRRLLIRNRYAIKKQK